MSRTTIEELAERLDGLERANRQLGRECRRWRRVGALVLAGSAVLTIAGAAGRTWAPVEAGEFVLRDKDGTARAALTIRPDGSPGLGFFDKAGQVRLSIDLGANDAPGLNIYDDGGVLRAALALRPDGTPGLGLFDKAGRIGRSLDLGPDGDQARARPR